MLNRLWIIAFLIFPLLHANAQARRSLSEGLQKGGYSFDFIYQKIDTLSFFDDAGENTELASGESYSINEIDLIGSYGYSNNLQFKVGLKHRSINSVFLDTDDSNLYTVSDNGLHSALLGIHYIFNRLDNLIYRFEFDYRHFNYSNIIVTNQNKHEFLALGADGRQIDFALALTYRPKTWNSFISAKIGYRMPGTNLSDQMIYQLEFSKVWRYFAMFAGLDVAQSLNGDPYGAQDPQRPVYATGASRNFNAINPEATTPYAGISIGLGDRWKLHLKGAQTATGANFDKQQIASLHLEYFNTNPSQRNLYDEQFKDYSYEGDIKKISPSGEYATISVGLADGANIGDRVDIYKDDFLGGNELVAVGQIVKAGGSTSIIKIIKFYKGRVKEGMNARGSN
jgi:hypothetical protein